MAIRTPRLSEYRFDVQVLPYETVVTPGSSSSTVIDDSELDVFEAATVDSTGQVFVQPVVGDVENVTFRSLHENIGTVNVLGQVTRVTDGVCTIVARSPLLGRKINVTCARQTGAETTVLTGFKTGTFARASADNLEPLLVDGKSTSYYTSINFAGKTYVRNVDFWGHGLDLTPFPAAHSHKQTPERGGILVTPKHLLHAWHYRLSVGATSHFVTADNVCHERTVVDCTRVNSTRDMAIAEYDEELPEGIVPAKLLPADWRDYVGNPYGSSVYPGSVVTFASQLPMFTQNKAGRGYAFRLYGTGDFSEQRGYPAFDVRGGPSLVEPGMSFTGDIVSGDSGGAVCFLLNDAPIVAYCHHGAFIGDDLSQYLTEINSACGDYDVTTVNLSAFENFA